MKTNVRYILKKKTFEMCLPDLHYSHNAIDIEM